MIPVVLRGGPRDGMAFDVYEGTHTVRMPYMPEGRAYSPAEFNDPANWEWDPVYGMPRLKQPKVSFFDYTMTDEREGGRVVFR